MATLVFLWLMVATGLASANSDERVTYNPTLCKTPADEKIFIRLASGLSFAFPYRDLGPLRGQTHNPRPVLDPDEPEGCPDNPILTPAVDLVYRAVLPRDPAEPDGSRWGPRRFVITGHHGPERGANSFRRFFKRYCEEGDFGTLVVHASGIRECFTPPQDGRILKNSSSYAVPTTGQHLSYKGKNLVLRCDSAFLPGRSRVCRVTYQLDHGLSTVYSFDDGLIPVPEILKFDLQIRAFIEAHRTPHLDALPIRDLSPRDE